MTITRTPARLALAACFTLSAVTLPGHAAVTFTSAEVTVSALAVEWLFYVSDVDTKSDLATAPRRLLAEASALASGVQNVVAAATISALADFGADGATGLLSAGFDMSVTGPALAAVNYSFIYRFDITTPSIIQGDWTVSHPADLTLRLTGPSGVTVPLASNFGTHRNQLAPGSYELSFSTLGETDTLGYTLSSGGPRQTARGFDNYAFVIFDTPPVPEPGSWALMALGLGCGAWRLRSQRGLARAGRTPASDDTPA